MNEQDLTRRVNWSFRISAQSAQNADPEQMEYPALIGLVRGMLAADHRNPNRRRGNAALPR